MTDNRETIAMLKVLKEQALKSHNDTAVLKVTIDSFNFVIDKAIKALEQQPCDDWHDVPSDEMTLEQARQAVKDLRKKLVEYLEQQPCDDCVSREAVLETIEDCNSDGLKGIFCSYNDGKRFTEYIKALPPVTQKKKTGRWIYKQGIFGAVYCSKCDFELKVNNTKYCPNCGARMEVSVR